MEMSCDDVVFRDRSEAPPPPMNVDENLEDVEMKQCAEFDKSAAYYCYSYLLQEIDQPPRGPPSPPRVAPLFSSDVDHDSEYSLIENSKIEINAWRMHLSLVESGMISELQSKLGDEYGLHFVAESKNCWKVLHEAVNYIHDVTKFGGDGKSQLIATRKKFLEFHDLYRKLLHQIELKRKKK